MKKYLFIIGFLLFSLAATAQGTQKINGLRFTPKAAPGTPVDGEVYYDSTTKKTYQWNGTSWIDWSGGGGAGSDWGTITGTISNQTDLQAELNAKAGLSATQTFTGGNTFTTSPTINNGAVSTVYTKNSTATGHGPPLGFGAVYFKDNKVRFATTTGSVSNSFNFGMDIGALTVNKDLVVTDADITYNGTSLLNDGIPADNSVTSAKIVDGTIALADLSATGTKNSTTFYRGDNTFGVPLNIENSNLNIGNNQRVLDLGVTGSFKITQGASEFFTVNNSGANMTLQSDPYDSSWASLYNPASKADVYNKIETLGGGTAATTSYDNTTSGLTATNVKTAIDELKTNINTITGAAPLQLTASRAFTNSDLNRPLWSNTGTELVMTVNDGLGSEGDIIHMTPLSTNSVIKPISGTATLVNTFKTTSVVGQPLVYRKINGSWVADPRDGVAYVGGNPNPELIINNAASYTAETNAIPTTDNQTQSPLSATVTSVAEATNGKGSFVMRVVSTSTTSGSQRHYLNGLTNGAVYESKLLVRQTVGTAGRFLFTGSSVNNSTFFSSGTWTEYSHDLTMTGTQLILNAYAVSGSGAVNDTIEYKWSVKLKE